MIVALVSGEIGAGKTTICQKVVESARTRGVTCGGLSTPALVEHGRKVGIVGVDLRSGERRVMARIDRDLGGPRVGCYYFMADAFPWANAVIASAVEAGCDLLVVDEIGPLELMQGGGLIPALDLLDAIPRALVVVRLSLVEALRNRLQTKQWTTPTLPSLRVFVTTLDSRDRLPKEITGWLFDPQHH
ncbi:MAG: nucleoside-triphosphatase [Anaerolineae bacterium]|jgi:nucleoside-triphosphatase THEP1|nr:nucleoside-triphosphatase [Anaerolineae bacterium]MDH7475497.1 nucleoside-triphosphatase [Anaerolineae bacterium]